MGAFIDLTGQKFGRLTVIRRTESTNKNIKWVCLCECGNYTNVFGIDLKSGKTQSCGCVHSEQLTKRNYKHGLCDDPLRVVWSGLKDRCYNMNCKAYKNYGGREITVCDEWRNDFQAFYYWAMSNGYKNGLTIDRIDVNGNYEPSNCRWATMKEQANNKRNNRLITYNGKTQTITQWADETGIERRTISARISRGWNIERTLSTP